MDESSKSQGPQNPKTPNMLRKEPARDPAQICFADEVRKMREQELPGYRANRYPWQSRIIFDNLFELAKDRRLPIFIFSGMSETSFYDLPAKCSEALMSSGQITVTIVFAQPLTPEQQLTWTRVCQDYPRRADVRFCRRYEQALPHMFLVGQQAYRFETPHTNDPTPPTDFQPERPARFSFKDPQIAGQLVQYADALKAASQPISLPKQFQQHAS